MYNREGEGGGLFAQGLIEVGASPIRIFIFRPWSGEEEELQVAGNRLYMLVGKGGKPRPGAPPLESSYIHDKERGVGGLPLLARLAN